MLCHNININMICTEKRISSLGLPPQFCIIYLLKDKICQKKFKPYLLRLTWNISWSANQTVLPWVYSSWFLHAYSSSFRSYDKPSCRLPIHKITQFTWHTPGKFLLCPPPAPASPRLVALVLWAEPPAAGVSVLRAEPDQLPHPGPVPLLQPHHAPSRVQEAADVGHEGGQLLLRLQQEPHRPLVRRVGESSSLLLVEWTINYDKWHACNVQR